GMAVFALYVTLSLRVISMIWTLFFAAVLFFSGGRSAFFGVFASGIVTGCLLAEQRLTRKYYRHIALGWLLIGLLISFTGVGRLTESVGSSVLSGSHIG